MAGKSEKPRLEIDGDRFSDLQGFYREISDRIIPGADWGRNLDAFNDILGGGFGTPPNGFVLVWRNADKSKVDLGYPETVRQLDRRQPRCHPANTAHVRQQLEDARQGLGPTVFDWLMDIISGHADIELVLE